MELLLPASVTATGTRDPSCVCDLHHSSWQSWTLNPLNKARDWTWPYGYWGTPSQSSWVRTSCSQSEYSSRLLIYVRRRGVHVNRYIGWQVLSHILHDLESHENISIASFLPTLQTDPCMCRKEYRNTRDWEEVTCTSSIQIWMNKWIALSSHL